VKVARILNADGPRLHPGAADRAEGDAYAVPKYQSDFKIDLDIEWLPSGKLATNALILACAELACKIMRRINQNGLLGPDAPPRYRAKRRRTRTAALTGDRSCSERAGHGSRRSAGSPEHRAVPARAGLPIALHAQHYSRGERSIRHPTPPASQTTLPCPR
jgi:hypothetical protein